MAQFLYVALAPLLASAVQGARLAARLDSIPHDIVDFHGEQHGAPPAMELTVMTHGHALVVALAKHETLFAPGYEHIVVDRDGSVASREPIGASGHCIYRGHLFNASTTDRSPIGCVAATPPPPHLAWGAARSAPLRAHALTSPPIAARLNRAPLSLP